MSGQSSPHLSYRPSLSSQNDLEGHIQVIYGPMFSGKTTELLRRMRRYMIAKKNCLVIKYAKDTRYDNQCASTHDLQKCEARGCVALRELDENELQSIDVIGIDEGQFFPDVVEFCDDWANRGKVVIVSALDGTFERKPFARILELIPLAEQVMKLNAVCMVCHKEAAFTRRIGNEKTVEVIGGADKYLSTCRACFNAPISQPPPPSPFCVDSSSPVSPAAHTPKFTAAPPAKLNHVPPAYPVRAASAPSNAVLDESEQVAAPAPENANNNNQQQRKRKMDSSPSKHVAVSSSKRVMGIQHNLVGEFALKKNVQPVALSNEDKENIKPVAC